MAESSKDHTQIEIKPPQPSDPMREQRVPFFRPISQRSENTWVISLFVILHLVAFSATMFVNDCWRNSHGDCALSGLGRLSFQPLSENPLLGPSASTLDEMGALRQTFWTKRHQIWRLFTCQWLHAGVIHLVINLSCVIFIGIHLEQEFGPSRIGIIYTLSGFVGSLVAALFVQNSPAVAASGALFGLIGAMFSGLIRNWELYTNKFAALLALFFVSMINFVLGLLPYIDNFSNIGGFISGFLLGFVLLFSPQLGQLSQNKVGLFDYDVKSSVGFKQKLDRPVLRSVSLVIFGFLLAGAILAVLHGIDVNNYCGWCQYINCVPSERWSCNDKAIPCEIMETSGRLTLTCTGNDNFMVLPFSSISQARKEDLCSLICS